MADRIRLTVSQIQSTASTFKNDSDEINSILSTLTSEKNKLLAAWEGDSAKAFSDEFENMAPKIRDFSTLVGQVGNQLNKAGRDMQDTDTRLASSLRK